MLEYLPAYAPELNPVECIWLTKQQEFPNLCVRDFGQPSHRGRRALARETLHQRGRRPTGVANAKLAHLFALKAEHDEC